MEHEVRSERLNETITGDYYGCPAMINYETANDPIPRNLTATLRIPSEIDPMQDTRVTITMNITGSLDWTVMAVPKTGNLTALIAGIEAVLQSFMLSVV